MTETIQAALSPLLIVGSFCGLSFFEYPLGRSWPYLTCLYFLITWSFYVYLFYYIVYTSKLYLPWTTLVVIFCAIVSMFISLFRYKKLKTCLCKLSIVDDTLEMLGTSKEYRRLYKWTIRMTIGWILLALFMNSCDALWLSYQNLNISHICVPFIVNHMYHVNALSGLIWAVILRYISSRFHQINEHIHDLIKDNAMCTKRQNKLILSAPENTKEQKKCRQYMWIIMHVHLELCFISRELNEVFSIQMTLQMASYFVFFIEMCCDIYTAYVDNNVDTFQNFLDKLFAYIWTAVYTAKLIALNDICQIICDKANETATILYKLSNDNLDKDFQEQILQFILQIKRKKVKFYGMGLFYFGYDFIRKFYTTVAAVLVIIIQMHITSSNLLSYDDEILDES